MASTKFSIEGTSIDSGLVTVSAETVINLVVLDTAGLTSITWSCVGTHEAATTTATITALITPAGNPNGATASFTMPAGAGQCYKLRAKGIDANGNEVNSYGLVGVETSAGYVPACAGEELERHPTQGWTDFLNERLASTVATQTLAVVLANGASANSIEITDGADPTSAQSLATKAYVDTTALTAPTDPGEDNLVAIASGGDLTYAQIAAAQIASNAVETAKILDENVTLAKLASDVNLAGVLDHGSDANGESITNLTNVEADGYYEVSRASTYTTPSTGIFRTTLGAWVARTNADNGDRNVIGYLSSDQVEIGDDDLANGLDYKSGSNHIWWIASTARGILTVSSDDAIFELIATTGNDAIFKADDVNVATAAPGAWLQASANAGAGDDGDAGIRNAAGTARIWHDASEGVDKMGDLSGGAVLATVSTAALELGNEGGTPSTPASNLIRIYNESSAFKWIDDAGVVHS